MTRHSATRDHRIVIVGGGFSGLGVALALRRAGIDDFVLLEKAAQLGGTWRDNTYPGCACDVPSQLYSFSSHPSARWSRVFAGQPEIQRYLLDVAARSGLDANMQFGTELLRAAWDVPMQRWILETSHGTMHARALVLATGPLHEPRLPDIPGLAEFEGTAFHTARWRHDHDLHGRRVAVVGTGSSAIQLVPEIQPRVERLVLFQRTPAWVLPKLDHRYPALQRAAFEHVPGLRRAYRAGLYGALELLQLAQRRPAVMRRLQWIGERHLARSIADPGLRRMLTPSFTLGCKRLLLSNTYYPALQQPNVEVVSGGLTRITARGAVGADGIERPIDTLILSTGFHVTDSPIADRILGSDGRSLAACWQGSPEAYLGTSVHGFPNLFYMLGPNLGNGHSSAFVLIEAQAEYIVDAVRTMAARGLSSIDVRADVQARFNDAVQHALAGTVWNAGGCASWYIDGNGRNSTIYPWTTLDLRRRLHRFDVKAYDVRPAKPRRVRPRSLPLRGAVVAITGGAHGIGRAAAGRFADAGAIVCIGDLDLPEAQRVAADLPRARAFPLDVTSRASFTRFVDRIEHEVGPIDVLINNAGVMPTGSWLSQPEQTDEAAMAVNYFGPALGMRLVVPRMVERGHGHVVNVASMAGRVHVKGLASYVASKHAAVGLSDATREELRGTGVTVTAILPGPVRTRLSAGIPLHGLRTVEPDDVARAIVASCRTRAPEVAVPGWLALLPVVETLLPRAAMRLFRRAIGEDRVLGSANTHVRADYEASARRHVLRPEAADRGTTEVANSS